MDDVRNIFALTSALEAHHMEWSTREWTEGMMLKSTPDIEASMDS